MTVIDIGVFAHNEAGRIGPMLESLFDQDIFTDPRYAPRLHILANGCRDKTVAEAREVVAARGMEAIIAVHDLAEGGKSRTWNRFVHDLSRPEAEMLVFMDADIHIPDPRVLDALVSFVAGRTDLAGASSKAVKDIVHDPSLARGGLDKLIAAAGGTLDNWRNSICGQLYVLRSADARSFHLPIGLPVEDGFVRAMVQTRNFTQMHGPDRLDGRDEIFHVYESERGIGALIRHQTRIVIGSAINAVIFGQISTAPPAERGPMLARAAQDPQWLPALLRQELPRAPWGYVPVHFLIKRLHAWRASPERMKPKRILVTLAGFVFDAVVYLRAQYAMWRGAGAGYW